MIELKLLSIKIFLIKFKLKLKIVLRNINVLKTNPWTYKIKDLNEKKTI